MLYLAHERFLDLYIHNWIDTAAGLEQSYQKQFADYLQRDGVALREEEKQFSYIKEAYQEYFREPFNSKAIPPRNITSSMMVENSPGSVEASRWCGTLVYFTR